MEIKTLVIQVAMFLWPFLIKYWPKAKGIPNDIIPWANGLLALVTGLASISAGGAITLGGVTSGVVFAGAVLFAATRWGAAFASLLTVTVAFGWLALVAPPSAFAASGVAGGAVAWLAPVLSAGWESIKVSLVYKIFGQAPAEKGLGWVNHEKRERQKLGLA